MNTNHNGKREKKRVKETVKEMKRNKQKRKLVVLKGRPSHFTQDLVIH